MWADMDTEARTYGLIALFFIIASVVLLVLWWTAENDADKLDEARRAAQKHAVEETKRANAAEAEIERMRANMRAGLDRHFGQTPYGDSDPTKTLIMTANGRPLNLGDTT